MQPVVPYQLLQQLGTCQIGGVWSAVDEQQRALAVAVLDAGIAGESRWRDAFAATTNTIAQSESGPVPSGHVQPEARPGPEPTLVQLAYVE